MPDLLMPESLPIRLRYGPLPDVDTIGDRHAVAIDYKNIAIQRGLASSANKTKWRELFAALNTMTDWRPPYRFWRIDDTGRLAWDTEWYFHLPFPLHSVAWFDLGLIEWQYQHNPGTGHTAKTAVYHTDDITQLLRHIGFDFAVQDNIARIWNYQPRINADFSLPEPSPPKQPFFDSARRLKTHSSGRYE